MLDFFNFYFLPFQNLLHLMVAKYMYFYLLMNKDYIIIIFLLLLQPTT